MAFPIRPRAPPQCSACIRSYAWFSLVDSTPPTAGFGQQIRGKKKMAKPSGVVPVRLLKDLEGFGRRGAIVPVTPGEMRNKFFPRRIAEYVTLPERRTLRLNNVPIERDYTFGREQPVADAAPELGGVPGMQEPTPSIAQPKVPELDKLTPERSTQLLDIFVKPVLEFYRQPIPEEKPSEEPAAPEPRRERQRSASSAAADLLEARSSAPLERPKSAGPQAIYGSVSTQDVLKHIRAAIARNDEAAKVILAEDDIRFLDRDVEAERRVKVVGDFTIEITPKGADEAIKRTVRVVPQEA